MLHLPGPFAFLIKFRNGRLAQVQSFLHLRDDVSADVAGSVNGLSAQMGRNDEVVALEQGAVEVSALAQLVHHNVGGVAADLAGLQSFVHILLVHDAAAGHVQHDAVRLHGGDALGIDQVLGGGQQRHMDGNVVSNLQQIFDGLHLGGVVLAELLVGQEGIVSHNVHLEGMSQTGNQLAFKNLILQYCNYEMFDDDKSLNIDINSGGKAQYISNGVCTEMTWNRDSTTGITHYYMADGSEVKLNTGKTYVGIILNPNAERVQITE